MEWIIYDTGATRIGYDYRWSPNDSEEVFKWWDWMMVKSGNCSTGLLVRPKPENETLAASSQTGIRKPSTLANKDLAMRLISQIRKRPHVAFSILCLITALSGYVYTYTNSTPGKHVSIVFLYLSAAIGAYFCLRQLVRMTRIRFFMKKYDSSYWDARLWRNAEDG